MTTTDSVIYLILVAVGLLSHPAAIAGVGLVGLVVCWWLWGRQK